MTNTCIDINVHPKASGIVAYIEISLSDGEVDAPRSLVFRKESITLPSGEKSQQFITDPSRALSAANQQDSVLDSAISDPTITVLAFQGFYGKKSAEYITSKNQKLDRMKHAYTINEDERYNFGNIGFRNTVIGIRDDRNIKSKYIVFTAPVNQSEQPKSITEVFAEIQKGKSL